MRLHLDSALQIAIFNALSSECYNLSKVDTILDLPAKQVATERSNPVMIHFMQSSAQPPSQSQVCDSRNSGPGSSSSLSEV